MYKEEDQVANATNTEIRCMHYIVLLEVTGKM